MENKIYPVYYQNKNKKIRDKIFRNTVINIGIAIVVCIIIIGIIVAFV